MSGAGAAPLLDPVLKQAGGIGLPHTYAGDVKFSRMKMASNFSPCTTWGNVATQSWPTN